MNIRLRDKFGKEYTTSSFFDYLEKEFIIDCKERDFKIRKDEEGLLVQFFDEWLPATKIYYARDGLQILHISTHYTGEPGPD
jgi:hypothetical protein